MLFTLEFIALGFLGYLPERVEELPMRSFRHLSSQGAFLPLLIVEGWVQPQKAEAGVSIGFLRNSGHVWSFSVKFSHPLGISTRSINIKAKIQSANIVCFFLTRAYRTYVELFHSQLPEGWMRENVGSFVFRLSCSAIPCCRDISPRARLLNQNMREP